MSQQANSKHPTSAKRLKLKVAPLRNLGVDKPVGRKILHDTGCRATQGGSCSINCTG